MSFEQRQEQKLTLKQKFFGDFISTSLAICTKCGYELSDDEIRAGFGNNPHDFNTTCPVCGRKFLSHLIIKDAKSGKEKESEPVLFMCEIQTLHAMKTIKEERGRIGITYLGKNNRQLFYNMVRWWGSYENATKMLN